MIRSYRLLTVLCALLAVGLPLHAQDPAIPDPNRIQMTRGELEALRAQYEESSASNVYSARFREGADSQLQMIRRRLEEGDFQVGDHVVLSVRGETQLTDTFTVNQGTLLVLPEVGEVRLAGVLRSELRDHLSGVLSQYLREPDVQAHALFRIMISGAVARAGYYVVPAQALVSEAIMQAGGFAAGADLKAVRILRGTSVIWDGAELQQAIAEGRTFDQMNVRAGDHLEVPAQRTSVGGFTMLQTALVLIPSLISLLTLF